MIAPRSKHVLWPRQQEYFELGWGGSQLVPLWSPHCNDYATTNSMIVAGGTPGRAFRAPHACRMNDGRILEVVCASENGTSNDNQISSIWGRISSDECENWGEYFLIYRRSDFNAGTKWLNTPAVPVCHNSGRVHILVSFSDGTGASDEVMTMRTLTNDDDTFKVWSGDGAGGAIRNISSQVIKTDNSTPENLPSCYLKTNAAWVWTMPTCAICQVHGANAGRIVVGGDHRYTLGAESWSHSFYTDDGASAQPTWALGGGFDESDSANDYSNECEVMERHDGSLYFNCRIEGGSNTRKRGQATVTGAITSTWAQLTTMSDGSAAIGANNCRAGSLTHSDGSLWMTFPIGLSLRCRLTAFRSTDGGVTWRESKAVYFGFTGYSELIELQDGVVRVGFEQSHNTTSDVFFQYIQQARINLDWLQSTTYPVVFHWHLNEGTSGVAGIPPDGSTGTILLDHGDGGERIYDQRGFAGGNVTWSDTGLTFAGSGTVTVLQEAQATNIGGALDPGYGSLTIEIDATVQASGRTLFDSANGADGNTEYGVSLGLNGLGRLQGRVRDSSTANGVTAATTVPSTGNLADGVRRTYILIVDRTANLLKTLTAVNGVATAYGTNASLASVTGSIYGSQKTVIGSFADATLQLTANSIIHGVRVTRGVRTDGWLSSATTKVSPELLWANTTATLSERGSPASFSNNVLWLGDAKRGQGMRADQYGCWDRVRVPAVLGQGSIAYRDLAGGRKFTYGASLNRGAYIDYDQHVGRFYRPMFSLQSQMAHWLLSYVETTAFNFVHATGMASIFACFNHYQDHTGAIFDCVNNGNSAGVRGFGLYVSSTTRAVSLRTSDGSGGVAPFNEGATGITAPINTWVCIGAVLSGNGAKVQFYKATITNGVVSAITAAQSSSNFATNAGGNISLALSVGALSNANSGMDWGVKEPMICNASLTQTDFQHYCNYCVQL